MNLYNLYTPSSLGYANKEASGYARAARLVRSRIYNALHNIPEVRSAFGLDLARQGLTGRAARTAERRAFMSKLPTIRADNVDAFNKYQSAWYSPNSQSPYVAYNMPLRMTESWLARGPVLSKYRNFDPLTVLAHEYGHGILGALTQNPVAMEKVRRAVLKEFSNNLSPMAKRAAREYNRAIGLAAITKTDKRKLRQAKRRLFRKKGVNALYTQLEGDELFADVVGSLVGETNRRNLEKALRRHARRFANRGNLNGSWWDIRRINVRALDPQERSKLLDRRIPARTDFDSVTPGRYDKYAERYAGLSAAGEYTARLQKMYQDLKEIFPKGMYYGLDKHTGLSGKALRKAVRDDGIDLPDDVLRYWQARMQANSNNPILQKEYPFSITHYSPVRPIAGKSSPPSKIDSYDYEF